MSRAFEIVLTPLIFGGAGYLLDGWLGTAPSFMIFLGVFAVAGVFVKLWLDYDRQMRKDEKAVAHHGRSAPAALIESRKPA